MTKEKQNDAMPSKGVRLRVDQWEDCDRFSETLKMASRNDFIRDAIDFYLEYLRRNNSVKFLTPALESVISAKVRDSEERLARLLFKLASIRICSRTRSRTALSSVPRRLTTCVMTRCARSKKQTEPSERMKY